MNINPQRELESRSRLPLPGEVPLKTWVMIQAERLGIGTKAVRRRMKRKQLVPVGRRRINARVIYVTLEGKP